MTIALADVGAIAAGIAGPVGSFLAVVALSMAVWSLFGGMGDR